MDLNSMLNNGPPPPKKSSQAASPQASAPPSTPGTNGHASVGDGGNLMSQRTPLHGPAPPPGASLSRSNTGLTPLQIQGHAQSGHYPFPQQSPANAASPSQYSRHPEAYSATTPGPRPPSLGYASQPGPTGVPSAVYQRANTSLSPTPPSHHSQHTPHSVRQSPLSVMSQSIHQPPAAQAYQTQYQHSQPSTPLGPPTMQYQRTSYHNSHGDVVHSPYHQRTLSGTSNGIVSHSPAQHHPSIGSLVESPNPYNHNLRRTSDYLAQMDRERSVSVSPKTKIPPRPPSLGSRQSSQQEMMYGSERSSMQAPSVASVAEIRHVSQQAQAQNVAQPLYSQSLLNGGVVQDNTISAQTPNPYSTVDRPGAPSTSLSQEANASPHLPLQHQTQKMGMNHLLTPASSITSTDAPSEIARLATQQHPLQADSTLFVRPSTKPNMPAPTAPSPRSSQVESSDAPNDATQPAPGTSVSPESVSPESNVGQAAGQTKKRPAGDALMTAAEPPAKRSKVMPIQRVRPIWARLQPDNERYKPEEHGPLDAATHIANGRSSKLVGRSNVASTEGQPSAVQTPQSNGNSVSRQQINGHSQPNGNGADVPPWQHHPPLDHDLIHSRSVLGPWEKTIKWNTPYPDMLRVVQDWLYLEMSKLEDVGNDPLEGTIEIEAKIGKIIRKDGDGERLVLPVMSTTVLSPKFHDKIAFESQMDHHEHAAMNAFLNTAVQGSHAPGRVQMQYAHPKQIDSFRTLSQAGIQALPQAFQRHHRRELRLRTSVDQKTNQVTARIVKIPMADLHIYNPSGDYDCRISINLEVNLNRPGLHYQDLIEEPTGDKLAPPDRKKDRLSYRHLNTYSIDLTRVDVNGIAPKFELELEVESRVLRNQMKLLSSGQPNAYGDVVSGFLDNTMFLMRCKATAGQAQSG